VNTIKEGGGGNPIRKLVGRGGGSRTPSGFPLAGGHRGEASNEKIKNKGRGPGGGGAENPRF